MNNPKKSFAPATCSRRSGVVAESQSGEKQLAVPGAAEGRKERSIMDIIFEHPAIWEWACGDSPSGAGNTPSDLSRERSGRD